MAVKLPFLFKGYLYVHNSLTQYLSIFTIVSLETFYITFLVNIILYYCIFYILGTFCYLLFKISFVYLIGFKPFDR